MTAKNPFTLLTKDPHCAARRGRMTLGHGTVETPAFMPVGTAGAVRALTPDMVENAGAEIILGNTYHLSLRPGADLIKKAGGLHKFVGWNRSMLTDSGGFQVFSLPGKKVTEEGVRFRYEVDGTPVTLTPETAIEIQETLGPDIMMAFDECLPFPCDKKYAIEGVDRTLRWAERCINARTRHDEVMLFGIIQGGVYDDLRKHCTEALNAMPFNGYAIGGVSVGEGLDLLVKVVRGTAPLMYEDRVRYLMGVGLPEDLLESITLGMDIFDCVIPTRFARSGTLFTSRGKIRIEHQRYRRDLYPIDPSCPCSVCQRFSRAYIRHLFISKEPLSQFLAGIHNVTFYQRLMAQAREAIEQGRFLQFKEEFYGSYGFNPGKPKTAKPEAQDRKPRGGPKKGS